MAKFSFYYADMSTIYMQTGFRTKDDSREGLEEIAGIFCRREGKKAIGKLRERKDGGELMVLEEYKIERKCDLNFC